MYLLEGGRVNFVSPILRRRSIVISAVLAFALQAAITVMLAQGFRVTPTVAIHPCEWNCFRPAPSILILTHPIPIPAPPFPCDWGECRRFPDPAPREPELIPIRPIPIGKPSNWISQSDYPTRDLLAGHQGTVHFALAVGANGKPQKCTVTISTGYQSLDQATCTAMLSRASFRPIIETNGGAISGTYDGAVRWVIPE